MDPKFTDFKEDFRLTRSNTRQIIHLTWTPKSLSITNTSKFPIYVRIGGTDIPSFLSNSGVIAPFSSYEKDPNGARDFCIVVDNSQDPGSEFNFPIMVNLSTGAAEVQGALSPTLIAPTSTAYINKLLGVQPGTLIDIWSTFDSPPSNTILDSVSQARNGQYPVIPNLQGDTFADNSNKIAVFDGVTQYGNVISNSLKNVFNPVQGTFLTWVKLPIAKWNDANTYQVTDFNVNGTNRVQVGKGSANNFSLVYDTNVVSFNIGAPSGWQAVVTTWNATLTRGRQYLNSVKQGADLTLTTTMTGTLVNAILANTSSLLAYFPGSLLVALWASELQQSDINIISVAP